MDGTEHWSERRMNGMEQQAGVNDGRHGCCSWLEWMEDRQDGAASLTEDG
jgi:hypothetical protein